MTSNKYNSFRKRLDSLIGSIDSIKEDIEEAGGFQTDTMKEEFEENLESVVISIQDAIQNLESDEACKLLNSDEEQYEA